MHFEMSWAVVTGLGFVLAGGALVVTGVVLLTVGYSQEAQSGVNISVSPAGVRGSF